MRDRRKHGGFTLVEALVAMGLATIVVGVLYYAFGFVFGQGSPSNLASLTDRSFINKDLRIAVRKLCSRVREGTQVISPCPGKTSAQLIFRDIINDLVRIRLLPGQTEVVSERFENGAYQRETRPKELITSAGHSVRPCYPIHIKNCANVSFTAISPTCVVVHLTVTGRNNVNTLMTSIALRNANLAY